ncbi:replication initiator [Allokutzneria oryzae]|uniref:Replication initiator n=1 Tax=Allokutzneria oryzae TaxID=1378989 RepID=A0ABV6A138_9PSEU
MSTSALVSRLSTEDERMVNLVRSKAFKSWRSKVEAVSGCAKPVRLTGSTCLQDTTGARFEEFEGQIFVPCNNRREAVCEPCAAKYAADTFHLIRAGLCGGKEVPEAVSGHVRVFATLTPPSFGAVHSQPRTRTGKARPCSCGEFHSDYDTRLGTPVDAAAYDYVGAVLWQAHSTELWRRFTITCARHLAAALGIAPGQLRHHLRISYAKVAEYQRRGLVHFHAVIRVDGPDGPTTRPPAGVTADLLCEVVRSAAAAVAVTSPHSDTVGTRTLVWGEQVDARPITAHDPDDPDALVRDHQVAGYIAKYATKGTGATSGVNRRIYEAKAIEDLDVSEHHKTMIATSWWLGGLEEFEALRLRKWAHMLGFRGHFLTKSRHYSTTFTAMRTTRAQFRLAEYLAGLGISDTERVSVVNDWHMTGVGYRSDAERDMASAIAARTAHRRSTHQGDSS